MKALKVNLPDPEHSHWSEEESKFVTHSHSHAGPHFHGLANGKAVTVYGLGNYSPKAAP